MRNDNLKANVSQFDQDVLKNDGYLYTETEKYSAKVANLRLSALVQWGFLQVGSCQSIIDIGCGDGNYTSEYLNNSKIAKISAYDPAAEAIGRAKVKNTKQKREINFFVGNCLDEAFCQKIEHHEVGIFRGVLHHLSNPALALNNASMYCNSLIIIEPNGLNIILKLIEKISPYHRAHEEKSFTRFKIEKWIKDAGFEICERQYAGFVPFFFPEFLAKIIYKFQPLLEKIPGLGMFFGAVSVHVCKRKNQL